MAAAVSSLVVLLSCLYLVWRAAQLWSAPLQLVFRYLQIELPSSPRLTVDALSADSVSLHWAPPESYVKKHIIQMDGQEVGISVRGETSVTISGLTPDYLYSIQVIAVNAHGFQVASPVFYVKTRSRPGSAREVEQSQEVEVEAHTTSSDAPALRVPKKKASMDILKIKDPLPGAQAFAKDEAKAIADLTSKMEGILKETTDIDAQITALNSHHTEEEQAFLKKLDEWRQKKKGEDDARATRDQHHKQLDQQKREIETRRNQVQKALKLAQEEYRRQCADMEGFAEAVRVSSEETAKLERQTRAMIAETDHAIKTSERAGALASEELVEVEAEIRYLLARKAEGEADISRLQSGSRVASPSPQEVNEAAKDDAQWKDREETLVRQYEDACQLLSRLQQGLRSGTPISEGSSNDLGSLRRRQSRKAKENIDHRHAMPSFNPDAAPFVAANNTSFYPETSFVGAAAHPYEAPSHSAAPPGLSRDPAPIMPGVTSIFNDDTLFPRRGSPFASAVIPGSLGGARRESPRSSQSGSNPSSPGVINPILHAPASYGMLPSIFNAGASHQLNSSLQLERERGGQRATSGSLVASLNGTPLSESQDHSAVSSAPGSVHNMQHSLGLGNGAGIVGKDRSLVTAATTNGTGNWFWPSSSKKVPINAQDPLALDRKNTRSLPKTDVAPIGTRRPRSGSLRGEDGGIIAPAGSRLGRTYQESERNAVSGQALSHGLPKPGDAATSMEFGWTSPKNGFQATTDPWTAPDVQGLSHSTTASSFDPFGSLPKLSMPAPTPSYHTAGLAEGRLLLSPDPESDTDTPFFTAPVTAPVGQPEPFYHTTIDASMLSGGNLQRELSNASSRKSNGSGSGDVSRRKLVGSGKQFTSFVGRVFGKNGEPSASQG
ncbi:hypothetical protein BCR37DRAFT_156348 [Protomyces lactucae-debilis]|uniref:Fibronectin type-III domain-containing protein n=1 Tax=Protomyces lactucae-debilis TaxID=2754530 RepID=A0A1Y2F0V7_PROLT|nr:uncharacterized protein BCR37DRAFT_156348 [Protomyces lactucae-debilis]ORY76976.1 hypothetical protein BCR37DRAFT_156348 [Protomyces lactucae-debilis]